MSDSVDAQKQMSSMKLWFERIRNQNSDANGEESKTSNIDAENSQNIVIEMKPAGSRLQKGSCFDPISCCCCLLICIPIGIIILIILYIAYASGSFKWSG
jgi:hypothetical protein